MTLLQLLNVTRDYFREKGIESARLDAEVLLAHCLGVDRLRLYLEHDRPMLAHELTAFRDPVRRRAGREPVAYITGRRDFWTLTLEIHPGVLIPRPETEVLVEHARAFLEPLQAAQPRVLDIGTGSGAIALALAAEMPHADIIAMDACARATACAQANARRLGCEGWVRVLQARFPEACTQAESFDLIVANPPYIPSAEIERLAPDIRQYEPHTALDGGADGLDMYRAWMPHIERLLAPGGAVLLEIGHDQAETVTELLAACGGLSDSALIRDYAGLNRVVFARRL